MAAYKHAYIKHGLEWNKYILCAQPANHGTPGMAPAPDASGALPAQSDAQPMAIDEAALNSVAFDPMAKPASRVEEIGVATPADDFDALLARGAADKAFTELPTVVFALVDTSMADRCAPAAASHAHLRCCPAQ